MLNFIWTVLIAFNCVMINASAPYKYVLRKLRLNIKPFNCAICLTFWTVLGLGLVNQDYILMAMSGLGAFLASEIDKQLNTF